jgi:hypothetical protein
MLGSSIVDVAIGLIFVYLLLSLICSAANETIERFSKKRAKDLERGLTEMLGNGGLVKSLYEHPLISSLFPDPYKAGAANLPSYIPARNFALALMDIACPRPVHKVGQAPRALRAQALPVRQGWALMTSQTNCQPPGHSGSQRPTPARRKEGAGDVCRCRV